MSDRTSRRTGNDAPLGTAPHPGTSARTASTILARKLLPKDSSVGQTLGKGYADTMSRGIELALTLVVVGAIGWGIDRVVGASPFFTLVFAVAGFAGISAKLWLGYDREMAEHEDGAIWNRGSLPVEPAGPAGAGADAGEALDADGRLAS